MDRKLVSCDTFVVLPPLTQYGVVFGKNSDRPKGEVQEIVYQSSRDHSIPSKQKCTYIEVDQIPHTHAVILSKPSWMWGAEMGANEHGVCVGNEAVFTKLVTNDDTTEKLLGMDLVRLALERSTTASDALDCIIHHLEKYGQGGPCSDIDTSFTYHNSFLIADCTEAWVLETAGKFWAAEKVTEGFRNISNVLTIGAKIDRKSENIEDVARDLGLWDGEAAFDFAEIFEGRSECGMQRWKDGEKLLKMKSESSTFTVSDMFSVLRDEDSGICRNMTCSYPTTSSQVSVLNGSNSGMPSCHWFTGTPDPQHSVFKPFIFCPNVKMSPAIQSPKIPDNEDPAKVIPRFQNSVDRRHRLYVLQQQALNESKASIEILRDLEKKCVEEVENFLNSWDPAKSPNEVEDLFKDVIDSEIRFYK